jgi:AcrR family transcriptional regulator
MKREKKVKSQRPYHSPKRTQQAEYTQRRIVDAARSLFHEHGYATTSLSAIAERAEVSVETIYAIFGSKRSLLLVLVEAARPTESLALPNLVRLRPVEQAAVLAQQARSIYEQHWEVIDVLRKASSAEPDAAAAWQEGDRLGRETQAPVIASWREQGVLKPGITPQAAADLLWALTGPDLYRLLVQECEWSHDAYQAWLAQALAALLLT